MTNERTEADGSGSDSGSVTPGFESRPSGREESAVQSPEEHPDGEQDEQLELTARVELLAEENRRLRAEYVRAQQSKYRRTAYGLGLVGALAILGGVLFSNGREVLFALGTTGLFGAVLTLYLSPGQFVAADVGERVYAAMAANETAIATELGLSENRVYVPTDGAARLYIPQQTEFEIPEETHTIIADGEGRGLFLEATGSALFTAFERGLTGELAESPPLLATQLADGLVEQFELASTVDTDTDKGRATFRIRGSAFGDVDRLDHPVVSFVAVGFAIGLDQPVSVDVVAGDKHADWLVTCRWETDELN